MKQAKSIEHGREVAPSRGLHPIQALDFDQVQVQIQLAPLTAENMRAFQAAETERIRALVDIRDSHVPRKAVVVMDGSNELLPGADVRRMQAEWLKEHHDLLRLVLHSISVVVPNPLTRGAVTAVTWMANTPCPIKTHASLEQAVAWAIDECIAIGGTVSEELLQGGVTAIEARRNALKNVHGGGPSKSVAEAV